MLNFNAQIQTMLNQVKENINQQEFISVVYPEAITEETWAFHANNIELPKEKAYIYLIYDENYNLLYIGKTKNLRFSLLNHLIRRTSPKTTSILDEVQELVCNGEEKKIYLKLIDVRPVELASSLKPYLIKELCPTLSKRLS